MVDNHKAKFLIFLSLLIIFMGLRLAYAVTGVKTVVADLLDMLIYKRNYNYDQKIETVWKNDYRYAKLVQQLVGGQESINFQNGDMGDTLHLHIIAYFVYPIKTSFSSVNNLFQYSAIYPGVRPTDENKCTKVYIFNLDQSSYTTLNCQDYIGKPTAYQDSFGLVKL